MVLKGQIPKDDLENKAETAVTTSLRSNSIKHSNIFKWSTRKKGQC